MTWGDAAYYLGRGLRRVALALPVEVLIEFDLQVNEVRFRSRNAMITEAIQHFLACPNADWELGDHPPSV